MSAFVALVAKLNGHVDVTRGAFTQPSQHRARVNTDFISYAFINALEKRGDCVHGRFAVLAEHLSNTYITDEQRAVGVAIFSRAQACYSAMSKLARRWKVARAKASACDHDIRMTVELDNLPPHHVINLYDDTGRTTYRFRLSDLIAMSLQALRNAPDLFVEPLPVKNPYTNIPFTVAQLYNFYFALKETRFDIPPVLAMYYRCGFNLVSFAQRHEAELREEAIGDLCRHGSDGQVYYYLLRMVRENRDDLGELTLSPGFPGGALIEAMRPFLGNYLRKSFSLNPALRQRSSIDLRGQLKRFGRLNPRFGRRVMRRLFGEAPSSGHVTAFVTDTTADTPPESPRGEVLESYDSDDDDDDSAAIRARIEDAIERARVRVEAIGAQSEDAESHTGPPAASTTSDSDPQSATESSSVAPDVENDSSAQRRTDIRRRNVASAVARRAESRATVRELMTRFVNRTAADTGNSPASPVWAERPHTPLPEDASEEDEITTAVAEIQESIEAIDSFVREVAARSAVSSSAETPDTPTSLHENPMFAPPSSPSNMASGHCDNNPGDAETADVPSTDVPSTEPPGDANGPDPAGEDSDVSF